jgi:putative SOS response-associated peptidase YedK
MIERYSIGATAKQLAERFELEEPNAHQARYNAAPSQLLPVITHEVPHGFSFFYWGQPPGWKKNKAPAEKIINTRGEQIAEKPVLVKNLMQHRCLVPADGFYVWKKIGKKTMIPWRFSLKDRRIFSFPALWEEYEDEEENSFHTFTLVTVPSTNVVLTVSERMPVIFDKANEEIWLNNESTETGLLALLTAIPADQLDGFAVSPQLNTISFDRPSLALPVPPADQFGNLTLFD